MSVVKSILLSSVAALAVLPSLASAQQASDAPQILDGASDTVSNTGNVPANEIVVTARRRAERLQDVPIAVTAISASAIARSGFANAQDIQYLTPTLQINRSGSEVFQIRGVGTPTTGYYLEQSVGVVVDGVAIALPGDVGLGALSDIAQVEVLRGPQGTLFGKNASAGLVNITTRQPSLDGLAFDGRVSYGERNDTRNAFTLNAPLSSNVAALVSGALQHQDGFVRNILNDRKLGSYTDKAVRAKLLWKPSDTFEARLSADYQDRDGTDPAYNFTFRSFGVTDGYGSGALGIVPGPDNTLVAQGTDMFFHTKRFGASLTLISDLGGPVLTSITAFRRVKTAYLIDNDGGPLEIQLTPNDTDSHQFSQELRIEAPKNALFDLQAGLFFYQRDGKQHFETHGTYGRVIPDGFQYYAYSGGRQEDNPSNTSYAVFADGTLHVTKTLHVEAGGRFTHDDVAATYWVLPVEGYLPIAAPIPVNNYADRFSNNDFSYRGSIRYDLFPTVTTYISYARGYKGPAFAATNASLERIRPETVKSWEAGIKASFLDRRVTANLALFNSKFTDFQTQARDPVTQVLSLTNAGGQRTKGVELEMTGRVIDSLNLSANISYTDAKFTDYASACYVGQTVAAGCVNATYQAAGVALPLVAKWSYSTAANYTLPIGKDYKADVSSNLFYKGASMSSLDPAMKVPGYTLVNANIGFGPKDDSWRIAVFARNLFDNYFVAKISRTFDGYLNTPTTEARRTLGVQLSCAFK